MARRKGGSDDGEPASDAASPAPDPRVEASRLFHLPEGARSLLGPAPRRLEGVLLALPIVIACVVLLGETGFPRARVAALALVGAAAVLSVTRGPSLAPRRDARLWPIPVSLATLSFGAAVALVGGASGPLVALLLVSPLAQAAQRRRRRHFALAASLTALTTVFLALAPEAWLGPALGRGRHDALFAVVTSGVAVALGMQALAVRRALARTSSHLTALREDLLGEHDLRVRGLESIGARVAHEIKNPLTSVKSLLALEREEPHGEETQRRLQVVDGELERIHRIVRDYLSYARPLDRMRPRRIDLRQIVRHAVEVFEGRGHDAGIDLVVSGPTAPVVADPHQLRGVLLNLIANAIEATPRGGTVGAETALVDDDVLVRVRDTGRGMSAATLARVGTPYFTTREGGTGLGVVIARAAVEEHGGSLVIESTEGVGTTVTVRLPRRARAHTDPTASYDELVHPELHVLLGGDAGKPGG